MSLHPKTPKDLALAPVAAGIDTNLQRLRDRHTDAEIEYELALELNEPVAAVDRAERATRVLAVALRDVDLHGWDAEVTEDGSAVRLRGGSVSVDIAVGAAVQRYVGEAAVTA
jgi:hypothetical protein